MGPGSIHITLARRAAALLLWPLFVLPGAARAQELAIALEGKGPPQPIASLTNGRWMTTPGTLACARDDDERIVAGGAVAARAPRVAAGSTEWKTLEPTIERVFAQRQREHEIAAAHLAEVPIEVEAIYRFAGPRGSAAVYYFEASRRVPDSGTAPDEDPRGTLRVAVSGWLLGAGNVITVLGSKGELGWAQDRPDAPPVGRSDLVPLGVITHESGSIWVMKGRAGDLAWVAAYLVGDAGVRTLGEPVRCAR